MTKINAIFIDSARHSVNRHPRMRTKGSCRFAEYYKIETYDEKRCCWRPIQKTFASYNEAKHAGPGGVSRIMKRDGKNFKEATA